MLNGGAGVLIEWPDDTSQELRAPAGGLCSSYRAELMAIRAALQHLLQHPAHEEDPVIFCTDSQAALAALRQGPTEQREQLAVEVREALTRLSAGATAPPVGPVPLRPARERASRRAGEGGGRSPSGRGTGGRQDGGPGGSQGGEIKDLQAASQRVVPRPDGGAPAAAGCRPGPVLGSGRPPTAGRPLHWAGSAQYLHRIGKKPTAECTGCDDVNCPAGLCLVCRDEADVPRHVLLRCPALMTARFRRTGSINPTCEEARSIDYVAAMVAATRRLQSREAS